MHPLPGAVNPNGGSFQRFASILACPSRLPVGTGGWHYSPMSANPILMYHHIGPAPPDAGGHRPLWVRREVLRRQLAELRGAGFRAVRPGEYLDALATPTAERVVWITFDDGWLNNYTDALPELVAAGMTATFFLVSDWSVGGRPDCLNVAQARELLAAGMSVGSHTCSHPHLARLSRAEVRRELCDSRAQLQDALGVPVDTFCLPYGSHNAAVIEEARAAGYRAVLSTVRGNRNADRDRWLLRRVMMTDDRVGAKLRYTMSGLYHAVHALKNRRRWKDGTA